MFGFGYLKAPPTMHVLHYRRGTLVRSGRGLTFFYYKPSSTVALVPAATADVPFVFQLVTRDFQAATVQGQITFRVVEPLKLATLLDFSVDGNGKYASDDPTKLAERVANAAQMIAQGVVGSLGLREALAGADALAAALDRGLAVDRQLTTLGLEPIAVSIVSIRATPEMARALEAEARERLQREADESIYARRNAAVAQERVIQESELDTQLAVEAKQREIRERKMAADIAVEDQRTALITRKAENDKTDADARAYALRATLEPVKNIDWKTLLAVSGAGGDPKLMIALAFRELAENASKIGELNVTPQLLEAVLKR